METGDDGGRGLGISETIGRDRTECDGSVALAMDSLTELERAVRDEQLARALEELDVTEAEAAVIERLANRLARRVLARPRHALATAGDDRAAEAVLALFE